jgi:glycosyltransferase involved in cell wall biosynthesis
MKCTGNKVRFRGLLMRLKKRFVLTRDYIENTLISKITRPYSRLNFVIEVGGWSIKWDGKYITEMLNSQRLLKARITTTYKGIHSQIIHFGAVNTFLTSEGFYILNKSNKIVLTWFHVTPNHPRIKHVKEAQKYIDLVHTSSTITRERLIEIGIPTKKIVVIPLGIDLNLFRPVSLNEKQKIRKRINIPKNKLVIGSFQKDGVGWGEGLKPKWVKGPDTFVNVVDELKTNYNLFILLLGPARGYVKRELDKRGIPYKHIFVKNYLEVPQYYNALDLYLVASRVEGGPKALLESMASGVPVVSTRVGMTPEIMRDDHNSILAEVDDVAGLFDRIVRIIDDKTLANRLVSNGLDTVNKYSWQKIAREFYKKIYSTLLS